jgi:hypothetical protein
VVLRRPDAGEARVGHVTPGQTPGHTPVIPCSNSRSKAGQELVKHWSNAGTTLVKSWSRTGQTLVERAARAQRVTGRSTRGGSGPAWGRQKPCGADPGQGGGGRAKAGPVRLTSRILVKHGQRGAWRRPAGCGPSAGMQSGQTIGQTFELVKPWIWSHHGSGQTIHLVKPGRVPADR